MSGPAWIECPRCGKTWRDDDVEYIHTCTPRDNAAQPDEDAELLPCPFCGGGNVTWHPRMNTTGCEDCNIYVSRFDKAEAIAAWNRRLARLAGGKPQVTMAFTVDEIRAGVQAVGRMVGSTEAEASDGEDMLIKQLCWLRANAEASRLSDRRLP
jgi:hypothetical protein